MTTPTETVADRHEAVGPFIVPDARGWTAGYSISCSCEAFTGDLHPLAKDDPDGRVPQIAAIRDHWKHLLDVSTMKESA